MNLRYGQRDVFGARYLAGLLYFSLFVVSPLRSQQNPNAAIVEKIDASVHAREQGLVGYTVTEHYRVFRSHDETHPVAEMVVNTRYQKDAGKSFSIVSITGSELMHKLLETVLDDERRLTQPANRVTAVIAPANYEMSVKGQEALDGRNCVVVSLKPRRESQYLLNGTEWVDAEDGAIVQLQGITARSPSIFAGASQVSRHYTIIDGFPMATHARAVSNSWLVGKTIITIDYANYQILPRQSK